MSVISVNHEQHTGGLKTPFQCKIINGGLAAHRRPGLEDGQLWILQPRPGWHPYKATGKEKSKAQPPSAWGFQENQQNSLGGFKVIRRLSPHPLLFLPKCETIRPGAVKGPEKEHEAKPNNWETETNFTLLYYRTCILLFICITSLLFLPLLFYEYFLFLFFLFSFLCFVCLVAWFHWFSLFSLSYCILIFLLSLH